MAILHMRRQQMNAMVQWYRRTLGRNDTEYRLDELRVFFQLENEYLTRQLIRYV